MFCKELNPDVYMLILTISESMFVQIPIKWIN